MRPDHPAEQYRARMAELDAAPPREPPPPRPVTIAPRPQPEPFNWGPLLAVLVAFGIPAFFYVLYLISH